MIFLTSLFCNQIFHTIGFPICTISKKMGLDGEIFNYYWLCFNSHLHDGSSLSSSKLEQFPSHSRVGSIFTFPFLSPVSSFLLWSCSCTNYLVTPKKKSGWEKFTFKLFTVNCFQFLFNFSLLWCLLDNNSSDNSTINFKIFGFLPCFFYPDQTKSENLGNPHRIFNYFDESKSALTCGHNCSSKTCSTATL